MKMKMNDLNLLRMRAGLPLIKEDSASSKSFGLVDENNVKTACVEIAKAGIPVDMEYFMETFYFNFKDAKQHEKAVKLLKSKLKLDSEDQFS